MDSKDSPPATPHPVHAAWSYSATHLNLWSRYAIGSRHQNRSLLSLRSNPPNEYEQANLWKEKAPAVPHRKGKSYCIRRIRFGAAKASTHRLFRPLKCLVQIYKTVLIPVQDLLQHIAVDLLSRKGLK